MKTENIRDKSADELKDQLISLKKEQFNLRFQKASGQMENTSRVRTIRREIAQVKTIQRQRDAAAKLAS